MADLELDHLALLVRSLAQNSTKSPSNVVR
jgi:hypothetical protein